MTIPSISNFSTSNSGLQRILAQLRLAQTSDHNTQLAVIADQLTTCQQLGAAYQAEITRIASDAHRSPSPPTGGRAPGHDTMSLYTDELAAINLAQVSLTSSGSQPGVAIAQAITALQTVSVR